MAESAFDLRDDDVVAELKIRVRRNGAMSVEGCIEEEVYAFAMLESARESIKNHNLRKRLREGKSVLLPPVSELIR